MTSYTFSYGYQKNRREKNTHALIRGGTTLGEGVSAYLIGLFGSLVEATER